MGQGSLFYLNYYACIIINTMFKIEKYGFLSKKKRFPNQGKRLNMLILLLLLRFYISFDGSTCTN